MTIKQPKISLMLGPSVSRLRACRTGPAIHPLCWTRDCRLRAMGSDQSLPRRAAPHFTTLHHSLLTPTAPSLAARCRRVSPAHGCAWSGGRRGAPPRRTAARCWTAEHAGMRLFLLPGCHRHMCCTRAILPMNLALSSSRSCRTSPSNKPTAASTCRSQTRCATDRANSFVLGGAP